jgi:autotransporter-associated beta strand protein
LTIAHLSIGSINDLSSTNEAIRGGTGGTTITFNGGGNSVSPNGGDLLYVPSGSLSFNNASGNSLVRLIIASNGNFDIGGSTTMQCSLGGTGTLTKTGTGTLQINQVSGFAGNFTGNWVVAAGTLKVNSTATVFQSPTSTNLFTVNGGTVDMNGKSGFWLGALNGTGGVITNSGTNTAFLNIFGGATGVYSGSILSGTTGTIGVDVSNITSGGSLFETFAGTNTYTGPTQVGNGTLEFATTKSLYNASQGSWAASNIQVSSGATLVVNVGPSGFSTGPTGDVATLLTNLASTPSAYGLESGSFFGFDTTGASATTTISNPLGNTNAGSGTLGYAKLGAGTLQLSGNLSNTGGVNVVAGTLILSGNNASFAGADTVASGATLQLQANGTNTLGGVCNALGTPSALTLSNNSSFQLRSDTSVTFAGTGTSEGNTVFNYDVNSLSGGTTNQTITVASPDPVFNNVINVTGGNGYTLNMGNLQFGDAGPLAYNAISASLQLGSIGSGTSVSFLSLTATGGKIAVNGNVNNSGSYNIFGTNSVTLSGSLSGYYVNNFDSGTVTLSGSNTLLGGVSSTAGTVVLANTNAVGVAGTSIFIQGTTTYQLLTDSGFGNNGAPLYNVSSTYPGPFTGNFLLGRATAGSTTGLTHNFNNLYMSLSGGAGETLLFNAGPNAPTGAVDTIAFNSLTLGNNNSVTETLSPSIVNVSIGSVSAVSGNTNNTVATLDLDGTSTGNQITGAISDTPSGSVNNAVAILKSNASTWTLSGSNTYSGGTNVSGGTLIIAGANAFPSNGSTGTPLIVGTGAVFQIAPHGTGGTSRVPIVSSLFNNGLIDITNNAMQFPGSTIGTVSSEVQAAYNSSTGVWAAAGNGLITSTTVGGLTTVGVATVNGVVEVKATFYGDATLDGQVNSADYTQIDNGFLSETGAGPVLTGWQNGDFNYDGVINGSDYTLIDNAFNTQGAQLLAQIAGPTAQIEGQIAGSGATSAVPEPASLGLSAFGLAGLLRRGRRGRAQ